MRLEELTAASARIAATRSRKEKTDLLAEIFRRLESDEIETAVAFLSGGPRQARLGIGGAQLGRALGGGRATTSRLTLLDVDLAFERIAALGGAGSAAERQRLLGARPPRKRNS